MVISITLASSVPEELMGGLTCVDSRNWPMQNIQTEAQCAAIILQLSIVMNTTKMYFT